MRWSTKNLTTFLQNQDKFYYWNTPKDAEDFIVLKNYNMRIDNKWYFIKMSMNHISKLKFEGQKLLIDQSSLITLKKAKEIQEPWTKTFTLRQLVGSNLWFEEYLYLFNKMEEIPIKSVQYISIDGV